VIGPDKAKNTTEFLLLRKGRNKSDNLKHLHHISVTRLSHVSAKLDSKHSLNYTMYYVNKTSSVHVTEH